MISTRKTLREGLQSVWPISNKYSHLLMHFPGHIMIRHHIDNVSWEKKQVGPDVDACAVSQHGYYTMLFSVFTFGRRQVSEMAEHWIMCIWEGVGGSCTLTQNMLFCASPHVPISVQRRWWAQMAWLEVQIYGKCPLTDAAHTRLFDTEMSEHEFF